MQFDNPISQNVANKLDSEIFSSESHGRSYPLAGMRAVVKTSLVDSGVNVRDALYGTSVEAFTVSTLVEKLKSSFKL